MNYKNKSFLSLSLSKIRNQRFGNKKWNDRVKLLLRNALKEDVGKGDITSRLLIPKNKEISGYIILKENAVIAGLSVIDEFFKIIGSSISFKPLCVDGSKQNKGKIIATLKGKAHAILSAERTALNFLNHLSGIATLTNKFVEKVKPYKVKIMDTRKTIPGLRELQKYAVVCGGGYNHRLGLWDGVLIKDNHLVIKPLNKSWQAIKYFRTKIPHSTKIEIEVKNLEEFQYALKAKPDIIMLDNMPIGKIKKVVKIKNRLKKRIHSPLIEVSGGITLNTVQKIAATGVDMISIGSITNSAHTIDMSLEILCGY